MKLVHFMTVHMFPYYSCLLVWRCSSSSFSVPLRFRPGRDGAHRFSLRLGTDLFVLCDVIVSVISVWALITCFIVCWQLSALLRSTDNPWKPDLWHHLHPAQRPHQDWLRSAPSRDFNVTASSRSAGFLFLYNNVIMTNEASKVNFPP